jgi:hypothetical protein
MNVSLNNKNQDHITKGHVYYLPWLRINKMIKLNEVSLIPYSKKDASNIQNMPKWIINRINVLSATYLNRKGKPLSYLTILAGPAGPIVESHDQHTPALFDKLELAFILSKSRYRDYDTGGHTGLQFSFHKAEIEKNKQRGFIVYRSWFKELWITTSIGQDKITIPWPVQLFSSGFHLPIRRVKEIFQSLQVNNAAIIQQIELPVRFLRLVCSDIPEIHPYISINALADAFEYLFNRHNILGRTAFSFKLEDVWNYKSRIRHYHPSPFKNKQLKELIKNKSFRLVKTPSTRKTWLQAWILEFFKLRNAILLCNPLKSKDYYWSITQHLRIASEILPMTILIMLNRDPSVLLPLKIEDEKRIKNVDLYIQYAKEDWFTSDTHQTDGPKWLKGQMHPKLWDSIP